MEVIIKLDSKDAVLLSEQLKEIGLAIDAVAEMENSDMKKDKVQDYTQDVIKSAYCQIIEQATTKDKQSLDETIKELKTQDIILKNRQAKLN